jgi:hypothetical protein
MEHPRHIQVTHILDYAYGDPDIEIRLSVELFNRSEDFRIMKQQAYSDALTDEEIGPITINYAYAPSTLTMEVAKQIIREKRGERECQKNYSFDNAGHIYTDSIRALSGYGDFFPSLLIDRYSIHKFYFLRISCSEEYPEVLSEMDLFFKETFSVIPREELIREVLADPSPSLRNLNMVFEYAHDRFQPYDDIVALYRKMLLSTDPVVLEDVLTELCCDVFYEQGLYARLLRPELTSILENSTGFSLPEEHLAQIREALEVLNAEP